MDQSQPNPNLSRKQFLVGAASLLGTAAVSLSPAKAAAGILSTQTVSLGVVKGERVVPATHSWVGDASLRDVRVSLRAFGEGPLMSVDAFGVADGKHLPFAAWTAGAKGASFRAPISRDGLRLSVVTKNGKKSQTSALTLGNGIAPGAKLAEGTYVVVAGPISWSQVRYDAETNTVNMPEGRQHLVLTISDIAAS